MKRWLERWFPKEERIKIAAHLISGLLLFLYRTWRITSTNEAVIEQVLKEYDGAIMVTWHGRIMVHFARFAHRGYYAMISRSNDGEMLTAIFACLGWRWVRGSTGRRPVEALRGGLNALSESGGVLAFTPDGPRGPACIAKPGVTYFAQKTGKPILCAGIAATPRKLLRSWDSCMIPLPFARVHIECSEPIFVSPTEDLEEATLRMQDTINELQAKAERHLGLPTKEMPTPPIAGGQTNYQN